MMQELYLATAEPRGGHILNIRVGVCLRHFHTTPYPNLTPGLKRPPILILLSVEMKAALVPLGPQAWDPPWDWCILVWDSVAFLRPKDMPIANNF